ncbi:uncharacterized protein LOC125104797 [Lutra lutra]|uniref:uncharacterized protein LOC125104797 n=1 Tax=Lutra lutra TaxID=9657 RepID=UPI001FD0CB5E|nr:uncharacterized protein LOC125104797 [Lutra lutra]
MGAHLCLLPEVCALSAWQSGILCPLLSLAFSLRLEPGPAARERSHQLSTERLGHALALLLPHPRSLPVTAGCKVLPIRKNLTPALKIPGPLWPHDTLMEWTHFALAMSTFLLGAQRGEEEGERGRGVGGSCLGTAETPLPTPLADKAGIQLGRPRVCREGCPHCQMRSPGLLSASWVPGPSCPRVGEVESSCGRRQALPSQEGYMEQGCGEKKPTHSSGFPFPPAVTQLAGGTFFSEEGSPGIISFTHAAQSQRGSWTSVWLPSQETCSAMVWGENLTSRRETWAPDQGKTLASHRTSPPPCPRSENMCLYSDFPGCLQEPHKFLGGDREGKPQIFLKR